MGVKENKRQRFIGSLESKLGLKFSASDSSVDGVDIWHAAERRGRLDWTVYLYCDYEDACDMIWFIIHCDDIKILDVQVVADSAEVENGYLLFSKKGELIRKFAICVGDNTGDGCFRVGL